MSNTIEQKVVEMRFDNKQFEKNVQTSMSTIDKLKQKLNFKGATKGLENIGNAASKVNMSGMGAAVDTMQAKFSALEIVGITALANITNSAVNAGKRIASELTIAPVMTGFQEYETQMNAIQTILANTQSKGSTLQDVSAALDELNKYADQTIYNFTEMTRNIGTFTAAGVDLDKSVTSIKGIANLAAVSGSSSQQASTAMYQLSQALAAGKVQLMDWNSVVNAGMGGELFQNALKRTATQMGYNVDAMIEKYGSFRESLTRGEWLTADVLTETLTQLSGAYTEADLIAQGYTEAQAKEITELAQTAVDAATKVKTFSQLWDTAKEAAQSGWAQTWKLIFGDFEEAKNFFTGISGMINDFIVASGEARNKVLGDALNSKWDTFIGKINEAGVSTEAYTEQLTAVAKEHGIAIDDLIKEHDSLTNVIYKGLLPTELYTEALSKFSGETTESAEVLKEANQYIVKSGDNLTAIAAKYGMTWQELYRLNQDIIRDPNLIYPEQILKLGDAQLKQAGYTEKQVTALKDLAEQADKTGTPINELIEQMGKPSGRQMLFASMSNAVSGFLKILSTIKSAWAAVFPPENLSNAIYRFIETLYNVSDGFVISDETANRLQRTFKGLFAIIDLVATFFGGGFKLALTVINKLLSAMGIPLLEVTATLGDAAVALHDFILENQLIDSVVDVAADGIVFLVTSVQKLITAFLAIPAVNAGIDAFIGKLRSIKDVAKDTIQGLQNGLTEGLYSIPDIMAKIGTVMLNAICEVLGIHSPSVEMKKVGMNTGLGLIEGLKGIISAIISTAKRVGGAVVDTIGGIIGSVDWGTVAAIGIGVATLLMAKKLLDIVDAITSPLIGLGDMLSEFGDVLDETADGIRRLSKAYAFSMKAAAIKNMAIAIAILAASIFVLAQVPPEKLFAAVAAIAALAGVLYILSKAVDTMSKASVSIGKDGASVTNLKPALLGIAASLLVLAVVMKILGGMSPNEIKHGFIGLAGAMGAMLLFVAVYCLLAKTKLTTGIDKASIAIVKISTAMSLLVFVIKQISKLDPADLVIGITTISMFAIFITTLMFATRLAGRNIDMVGGTLVKLSAAMLILVFVMKALTLVSPEDIVTGIATISALGLIIGELMLVTRLAGASQKGISSTILGLSVAIMLLVGAVKMISGLGVSEITKGMLTIAAFGLLIGELILISKLGGTKSSKIALNLLAMATAITVLAGISVILGFVNLKHMAKGILAVGMLGAIMSGMIIATRGASDCKKNIVAMTVAIALMAVAIVALSFIDPKKLASSTAALSMVMVSFAAMISAASKIQKPTGIIKIVSVMLAVTALLAVVIAAMSLLNPEKAIGVSAALSLLLVSFATAINLINKNVGPLQPSLKQLGVMLMVVLGLAVILGAMSKLKVGASIQTAIAIGVLLNAMAAAMLVLGYARAVTPNMVKSLALMGVIVGEIATVLGIMDALNVGASVQTATAIGVLLNAMAAAMLVLGYSMPVTPAAVGTLAIMGLVVAEIGVILGVMSAFDIQPSIGTAVSLSTLLLAMSAACLIISLVPAPAAISGALGLAAFVGILTGVITILGGLSKIPGFNDLISEGGGVLGKLGYALGNFVGSIVSGLGVGLTSGLPEIASNLSGFVTNLNPFITAANSIDESAANGAKSLADAILTITAANVLNGIASFLGVGGNMSAFAEQLIPFGEAMTKFSQTVSGKVDEGAITAAANAGKIMAEMAGTIPGTGGVVQFFTGEHDFAKFTEQLVPFGDAITKFSSTVKGKVDGGAVSAAANAGKMMTEMAGTIPGSGGVIQFFTGEHDFKKFTEQLVPFGDAIVAFSQTVDGKIDEGAVTAATNAGLAMAKLNEALPETDGVVQWWVGSKDMGKLKDSLSSFGDAIVAYSAKMSEGELNLSAIKTATTACGYLVDTINNTATIDTSGINSFGAALTKLGEASVDDFVNTFSNDDLKSKSVTAIRNFVSSVSARVTSEGVICDAFTSWVSDAIMSIRSKYFDFYSVGNYLVSGFCNGITNNTYRARLAAEAMAAAAAEAAKNELDEHSPSKVGYEIGDFFGVAFVNAIGEYANKAYRAGKNVASQAKSGLSSALTKAGDLLNADMDIQPTIRPVLDLSSVRSGVGVLNGMLGMTPSVKTMTNLGAISTMTNRRNQNGTSDIVSALNDLNKKFDNLPSGDTYTIGGVSYQDGSDVSNAIKVLVRAMKMEGRV